MRCPQCDFENRDGARFCKHCGGSLPAGGPEEAGPVCVHCGAALKPAARFCKRCGEPVAGTALPSTASLESPPGNAEFAAEAAIYAEPAYPVEPPLEAAPLPATRSRRLPRWLVWGGGGVALLCLLLVLALVVWRPFDKEATPTPPPEATATEESPPPTTATPTATPAPTPAPLRREALGDGARLTLSENPITVGEFLTLTVVFTNTGEAFARDVRVYLVQAGGALFGPPESTVSLAPGELAPQAQYTATFVLEALAAGLAPVEVNINLEWNTDPPSPELRRVGPVEVEVVLP